MTSFRRQLLLRCFLLFDLLVLVATLSFAIVVCQTGAWPTLKTVLLFPVRMRDLALVIVLSFAWHWTLSALGLYESRRLSSRLDETADVLKGSIGCVLPLAIAGAFKMSNITWPAIGLFWITTTPILILSRLILRLFLKLIRVHGRNLRNVLVIGTNRRAVQFAISIQNRPDLGYRLIGFVDECWAGPGAQRNGHSLISNFAGLPEFLRKHVVDEVVLALPVKSFYSHSSRIAAMCQEQGIVVRILCGLFESVADRSHVHELRNTSVITPVDGWCIALKRCIDIIGSGLLLVLLSPVFLICALLIKVDSPGSVIFEQERVGLNKRRFRMYKFRTMVMNAEALRETLEPNNEVSGPVFKMRNDPRITRLGKFLRKTSLDELPQLLNVLRGDMSLVGPRPLPIRDYEGFDQDWQRRRFSIRPGVTCLWQVSGRSSISFEQWMTLDMQYIDQWSLWLDMQILARTIPAVLKGSGAA